MAKLYNFQILRQDGFKLNPDDKIVNGVIKGLKRNDGKCPCYHGDEIPDEDLICPCKEYRENQHCRCNLYIEAKNESINEEIAANLEGAKVLIDNLQKELNDAQNEIKRISLANTTKAERLVY